MTSRIRFKSWGAINQASAREFAEDPDLVPAALRVFFAAMGWANRIGHAEFASNQLAEILAKIDPETGEFVPLSRQQVWNTIRDAKQRGLIGPGSNARCLILSGELWSKQTGESVCREHGQTGGHTT